MLNRKAINGQLEKHSAIFLLESRFFNHLSLYIHLYEFSHTFTFVIYKKRTKRKTFDHQYLPLDIMFLERGIAFTFIF
jgi:hypothetical protein